MTTSARPDHLEAFGTEAAAAELLTSPAVADAQSALDTFRATPGWEEFLEDVPPLDIDAGVVTGMVAALGTWTTSVAAAFRAAGTTPDDRAFTVDGWVAELLFNATVGPSPVGAGAALVQDGDRWIVVGTDEADHVRLERQPDGSYLVIVRTVDPSTGSTRESRIPVSAAQAANLTIRVGDGNDVIEVPSSHDLKVTTWAGDGDDLVGDGGENPLAAVGGGGDERIFLGDGDDIASGGDGDDALYGGAGIDALDGQDGHDLVVGGGDADALYGGRGDDEVLGGLGDDAVEGGLGDDTVAGSAGNDMVSGGRGNDVLTGGTGDDTLMGGRGDDQADAGSGASDRIVRETGEVTHGGEDVVTLELTGDPGATAIEIVQPDWMSDAEFAAWEERIDSDLELLRTTVTGRAGLEALDDAARSTDDSAKWWDRDRVIQIVPYGNDEGAFPFDPDGEDGPADERPYTVDDWLNGDTNPQPSYSSPPGNDLEHDVLVNYADDASRVYDSAQPPVTVLYHELAHGYDQFYGGVGGDYEEHVLDADGSPALDGEGNPIVNEYSRAELNSVGNDLDGDGDVDLVNPNPFVHHPETLTENAILDELGYPNRDYYGPTLDPGQSVRFESTEV